MGLVSNGLHWLADRWDGAGSNVETKDSGTFNTPADAYASTLGSQYNQNYSSFNNQKQQLNSYVEWVYVGVSVIAEHCAAIDFKLFENHTKMKNAALGEKLIYYPHVAQKIIQRKVSVIEQKGGQLKLRKNVSALEEIESHPLLDLMSAPNPFMVKNEFFETTFLHMMLAGEAFWVIFRDKKGKPSELWPLMPDRVTVVPDKTHFVVGYLYQVDGNQVPFAPDDIIHHKFSHPTDFHRGYSPIMAGARTIDTDSHASNWNRMTLYNGVGPGGVFQTDNKLDEIVYKRLKQEILDTYGGTQNHGKPIITEQGLKFTAGSMSAKDMDFINSRHFNRDQILSILGVPKEAVGLAESTSRAGAETIEYIFSKRNRNKMQRLVNRITEDLAIQFGPGLVMSFEDPVPKDKVFELQKMQAELAMAPSKTINQIRADEGDDAVDGGDEIWIQSTMVPLSVALEKAKNPQPAVVPVVDPTDEDNDITDNTDESDDDGSGDNADTSGQNDENDSSGSDSGDSGNSDSTSTKSIKKTVTERELPSIFINTYKIKKLPSFPSTMITIETKENGAKTKSPMPVADGCTRCDCCQGYGEHDTGYECYRCDASGSVTPKENEEPIPCGGRKDSDELYIDDNGTYQHVKSTVSSTKDLPDFPKPAVTPDKKPIVDPMDEPEHIELPPFPLALPDDPVHGTSKTITKDVVTEHPALQPNEAMQKFIFDRKQMTFGFERRMLRGAQEIFLLQKHEVLSNLPTLLAVKGEGKAKVKAAKKGKLNNLFDKTAAAAAWAGMLAPAYAQISLQAGNSAMDLVNNPVKYGYAEPTSENSNDLTAGSSEGSTSSSAATTGSGENATGIGSSAESTATTEPLEYDSTTPAIKQYFAERAGTKTNSGNVTDLKDSVGNLIDAETDKQLRAALAEGLSNGVGLQELSDSVESVYGAASGYRALRIARTESQAALQFASHQAWEQSGMVSSYIWRADGPNPCPICIALNGVVHKNLSDFPNGGSYAHPNCILPGQKVEATDVTAKITSSYDGPIVRITTGAGVNLSVTPKHRVATDKGWVFAEDLKSGDNVLSAPNGFKFPTSYDPEGNAIKSLIEDVVIPNSVVSQQVPATSVDFHGDETFCQDVNVVLVKRKLTDSADTSIAKFPDKAKFVTGNVHTHALIGFSSFDEFSMAALGATDSGLSLGGDLLPFFNSSVPELQEADLTAVTQSDASILESIGKDVSASADLWGKFIERFSGVVTLDPVVETRDDSYVGHVYDLSAKYGFYTTNSIITHNCACDTVPNEMSVASIIAPLVGASA
jgi:HK97 family phage portal protein